MSMRLGVMSLLATLALLTFSCAPGNRPDLAGTRLVQPSSGMRTDLARVLAGEIDVLVFYAPGFNCGACVEGVRNWDRVVGQRFSGRATAHVIVDGRQVPIENAGLLEDKAGLNASVWYDPAGSVRSALSLGDDSIVAGIARNGSVLFVVPLADGFFDDELVTLFLAKALNLENPPPDGQESLNSPNPSATAPSLGEWGSAIQESPSNSCRSPKQTTPAPME